MASAIVGPITRNFGLTLLLGISILAAPMVAMTCIDQHSNNKLVERRADPKIASAFARWWLCKALDYTPSSTPSNQRAAARWMDKAVADSFNQVFWTDEYGAKRGVVFVPTYYSRPVDCDGRSIVVSVSGDFVSVDHPALASHFVKIDLTVRPDGDGWRVGGWKLAYDPDCSKTIKFLSKSSAGKVQSDDNFRALSYFSTAADLEVSGNLIQATEAYSQSIKLNPQFACAYLNRGGLRFKAKQFDLAFDDFSKAIELDQTLWLAYFNRALVRSFVEESKAVISDYDKGISLCPRFPYAYNNRAAARAEQGDKQGALADYTMFIELASRDCVSHASRASQRLEMKDYIGALIDANESVRLGPASSIAYRTRGNVWFAMKIFSLAQNDFKQAERLEQLYGERW